MLSLIYSIYVLARPLCSELARVPGTTVWSRVVKDETAERLPGVLGFALGAPITFINARYQLSELMRAPAAKGAKCLLVAIKANGIVDIDFTGAQEFRQVIDDMRDRKIDVALARLESERANDTTRRTGLFDTLGRDHLFRSVEDAAGAFGRRAEPDN